MPSVVHSAFDGIFCINLDRRPDRWDEASREFESVAIKAERFPAIDGAALTGSFRVRFFGFRAARLGIIRSISNLIRTARDRKMRSVLIFEDDVVFSPGFEEAFARAFRDLPANWAGFWLAGNHRIEPTPVTDSLARIRKTYSCHAFAIRDILFEPALRRLESPFLRKPSDVVFAKLQAEWPCYAITPGIAFQRASHSDIEDGLMNYAKGLHRIR